MEEHPLKCIKHRTSNKISRLSDSEAAVRVKEGTYEYCPKHEWRKSKEITTSELRYECPYCLEVTLRHKRDVCKCVKKGGKNDKNRKHKNSSTKG